LNLIIVKLKLRFLRYQKFFNRWTIR